MSAMQSQFNRRDFLKGAAAGMMILPSIVSGKSTHEITPNNRLNLAFVGVGGKGASALRALGDETIIGFCDVDDRSITNARSREEWGADYSKILDDATAKGARWYRDYRVMFEELGDKLDGVVISTPDHMHFPITLSAMNLGIHVYCEKPLTHTVEEARRIGEKARSMNLSTQMGNQGHSNEGTRVVREWLQAGVIGSIREVHSWTDRPIWPQGMPGPDHSKYIPVIPKELDWDLWLGVAEERTYDPAYLPFKWRGFWDFGCGAIGDMACHIMDGAYWGLDLGMPTRIEATATPVNEFMAPRSAVVRFEFPARGKFDPLTYTWYEGGMLPPIPAGLDASVFADGSGGTLYIGEDAYILANSDSGSVRILPDERFQELKTSLPAKTLPRIKGEHEKNWTDGIRNGTTGSSNFEYAAGLTEMVLLGNVAMQARRPLDYDAGRMTFSNHPEADQYLAKAYRDGWILS